MGHFARLMLFIHGITRPTVKPRVTAELDERQDRVERRIAVLKEYRRAEAAMSRR